jgi:hypothetical protein
MTQPHDTNPLTDVGSFTGEGGDLASHLPANGDGSFGVTNLRAGDNRQRW